MEKAMLTLIIIILFSVLLAGCGDAHMEGIVLEVNDNELNLRNLSPNKYEEIKNDSVKKLQNEDVEGKRESLEWMDITYDNTVEFSKGDEVDVWIDGDIMSSYPGKAEAKKYQWINACATNSRSYGTIPLFNWFKLYLVLQD